MIFIFFRIIKIGYGIEPRIKKRFVFLIAWGLTEFLQFFTELSIKTYLFGWIENGDFTQSNNI